MCGVSTPLDLAACARRIAEPDNRVYEARFVRRMRERLCATGRYQQGDFAGLRTVMELDDRFTAPSFGFGNAANYYRTQSAIGYLDGDSRARAADPGERRYLHSVRDLRIGGGPRQPADRLRGDRARRPSGISRARAAPLLGGSGDNGLDRRDNAKKRPVRIVRGLE